MSLIGPTVKLYGDVKLGSNLIIEDNVVIGHPSADEVKAAMCNVDEFSSLDDFYMAATKEITIIGDNSIIRSGSIIYSGVKIGRNFDCGHHVVIREGVSLGDNVYIKSYCHLMKKVEVGSDCRLSGIIADNSRIGNQVSVFGILTHRYPKVEGIGSQQGPHIGDRCHIGRGAVILGPAEIGENSIVGANVFVNFDVPPNSLIIGVKGHVLQRDDLPSTPS